MILKYDQVISLPEDFPESGIQAPAHPSSNQNPQLHLMTDSSTQCNATASELLGSFLNALHSACECPRVCLCLQHTSPWLSGSCSFFIILCYSPLNHLQWHLHWIIFSEIYQKIVLLSSFEWAGHSVCLMVWSRLSASCSRLLAPWGQGLYQPCIFSLMHILGEQYRHVEKHVINILWITKECF